MSSPAPRRHVLVIAHDLVSARMAGPGIRYLELARVLAETCAVTLAIPNEPDLAPDSVRLCRYTGDWPALRTLAASADVAVASGFTFHAFPALADLGVPLVADLYDPFLVENLSLFAKASPDEQRATHARDLAVIEAACAAGDFFLCATARQRDWWLGVLAAQGRLNARTVADDPSLRRLVAEVPFGLPTRPFEAEGPGPRAAWNLAPDHRLILWGGGLWEWLDPLTLLRAMPLVLAQEPRARLLFPGTRHPNPAMPPMARTGEAMALADELGLGETVLWGDWVPYEGWPAVLRDADVAVSLHLDTLETRFCAVRSRVLSYIWAGLPIVATGGDAASSLVEQHGLGEVVGYEDVAGVAAALLRVLAQGRERYAPAFAALAPRLTWREVAQPLVEFCHAPRRAPDKEAGWGQPQPDVLQQTVAAQAAELEQLRGLVRGYESGRFMRGMRRLDGWKRRMVGVR